MKCNEIQDLILTNYIDKELSKEHRLMIEGHAGQCRQCREILRSVRSLNDSFSGAQGVELDKEKIWKNIVDQLDKEASSSVIYTPLRGASDWRGRLERLFRPALAVGILASLILAVAFYSTTGKQQTVRALPEEEQYLVSLADEIILAEQSDEFGDDFEMDLEAYFL